MVPGDYPLHEFYGVIGTRPSFGTGKLYPDFSNEWKAKGHDRVSVSYFFIKIELNHCKDSSNTYTTNITF